MKNKEFSIIQTAPNRFRVFDNIAERYAFGAFENMADAITHMNRLTEISRFRAQHQDAMIDILSGIDAPGDSLADRRLQS